MLDEIIKLHPVTQALSAGAFTYALTALGASVIFASRARDQRVFDLMLGFAAGVMIAASFWSLLAPAIAMSEGGPLPRWAPPALGFTLGAVFLGALDKILPHLHIGHPIDQAEGIKTSWHRSALLVSAITLHNVPEGLAIGVVIGAAATGLGEASSAGAMALALGIGIQNIPEGFAVAAALRREGMSRFKSFWYGQLSGIVEPLAAAVGAAAVALTEPLLPYALSFAAGAMIFIVVEEALPEARRAGNTDLASAGVIGGFALMMILDVGLG